MPDDRFAFEPVYDLRTARICGFEVVPRHARDAIRHRAHESGWSARQVAEVDAGTVVSAISLARHLDPSAPVQVDVAADTVVLARHRLRGALDGRGVAPMLEIGPAVAAAPVDALLDALAELRAWGFRIALDGVGRGFGPALVAEVRPDVVKLEPEVLARPGSGAEAVVRGVCEVAANAGTRVAATGIDDRGRLVSLHAAGVGLAQGPLLGERRGRPLPDTSAGPALLGLLDRASGMAPSAPPSRPPSRPGPTARPTPIRTLGTAPTTVRDDAVADTARTTLAEHPDAGGVVLVDANRRPTGYLHRGRFLLAMAGPFGHALWAAKPARDLADPPRVADERMPVRAAMELSLSGDPARGYDDLVLIGSDGACTGVVAVAELWRSSLRSGNDERPHRPDEPEVVPPAPRRAPTISTPGLPSVTSGLPPVAPGSPAGRVVAGRAPAGSTVVGAAPAGPASVGSTVVGSVGASSPFAPGPRAPGPLGPGPLGPAPVGSAPVGSAPVESAPMGSVPVGSAPIGSAPAVPGLAGFAAAQGPGHDAQPFGPGPVTPGPVTPGPATPGPATPGPATPGPATPGPATPGPATPGPATPGPATPEPVRDGASRPPGPAEPGRPPVTGPRRAEPAGAPGPDPAQIRAARAAAFGHGPGRPGPTHG